MGKSRIMKDCRTVGQLKEELKKFPDEAQLWGYEGSVIIHTKDYTAVIDCPEEPVVGWPKITITVGKGAGQ